MSSEKPTKKELREMLKAKISEKRIQRSSKVVRESILKKTLKDIGIDKDKFKADLASVQKQGGFTLEMKK